MKILFFSPHADINQHAIPEILLAEKLKTKKHEIFYITCQKNFRKICACMYAKGLNDDSHRLAKAEVCKQCTLKSKSILSTFNYNEIRLQDYISNSDQEIIKKIIYRAKKNKISDIKINRIPVGLFAAYEFLLTFKIKSLKFDKNNKQKYLIHLENTLIAQIATEKIINLLKPDRAVVYNAMYSINRIFFENCKINKIPCISIHSGGHKAYRNRTLMFTALPALNFKRNRSKLWKTFQNHHNTAKQKKYALEEIKAFQSGTDFWVYSIPSSSNGIDLKTIKNIPKGSKVITVLLSSFDEFFAATCTGFLKTPKNLLFENQIKWISFLIRLAKKNKNIFFIFRIHPREFPNKRETQTSSNAAYFHKLKKEKADNIWVNTPDENISLYDLIPITDLALTRTSTAGIEFLYAGKAVLGVDACLLTGYPPEFNTNCLSKSSYEKAILNQTSTIEDKKEAIERWLYFSTIHLADWHPDVWKLNKKSFFQKFLYKIWKYQNKEEWKILMHDYETFLERIQNTNRTEVYFDRIVSYLEQPYGARRQY